MKYNISLLVIVVALSVNSIAQSSELSKSINRYSCELYKELKEKGDNLFFSPLSTYYALIMAMEGSHSSTRNEFDSVLHIENLLIIDNLHAFTNRISIKKDAINYLDIANSIWIQDDYLVETDYIQKLETEYSALIRTVDFSNSEVASGEINKWVNEKTQGLIPQMFNPDDLTGTQLVLTNAIYFIGQWADPFDINLTKPENFYSPSQEMKKMDFMNKDDYYQYYENDDLQCISLPYSDEEKSFVVILPRQKNGVSYLETRLDPAYIKSLFDNTISKGAYTRVKLSLPKFKIETNYSLNQALESMGLKLAFSNSADFSGITKKSPLFINNVEHSAFIKIDEKNTEAAAVTSIDIVGSPNPYRIQPKVFKADHPFICLIVDKDSQIILFMGRITNPQN